MLGMQHLVLSLKTQEYLKVMVGTGYGWCVR